MDDESFYSNRAFFNLETPEIKEGVKSWSRRNKTKNALEAAASLSRTFKTIEDIDVSPKLRELLKTGTVVIKTVGRQQIAFYKDQDGDLWEIPKNKLKSLLKEFGTVLEGITGVVLLGIPLVEWARGKGGALEAKKGQYKAPDEYDEIERQVQRNAQRLNVAVSFLRNAKFLYDLLKPGIPLVTKYISS